MKVYSDEIYHHGIKGQKWGVRKYVTSSTIKGTSKVVGDASNAANQIYNNHASNKRNKLLNKAKHMSDDELRKATNRLNLENSYLNAKSQQMGKTTTQKILSTAGPVITTGLSAAALAVEIMKIRRGL